MMVTPPHLDSVSCWYIEESAHIVAHELNYDTDTVYEEGIN